MRILDRDLKKYLYGSFTVVFVYLKRADQKLPTRKLW